MKKKLITLTGLLWVCLFSSSAWAHGGHHDDPTHLHQQVAGVEVALQIQPFSDYAHYLTQRRLALPFPQKQTTPHVLMVVLTQNKTWLDTRVKLKLTDASGKAVGDSGGLTPYAAQEKSGKHYVFPVTLKPGQKYFAMVQFQGEKGIQRAAFHFQAPK